MKIFSPSDSAFQKYIITKALTDAAIYQTKLMEPEINQFEIRLRRILEIPDTKKYANPFELLQKALKAAEEAVFLPDFVIEDTLSAEEFYTVDQKAFLRACGYLRFVTSRFKGHPTQLLYHEAKILKYYWS